MPVWLTLQQRIAVITTPSTFAQLAFSSRAVIFPSGGLPSGGSPEPFLPAHYHQWVRSHQSFPAYFPKRIIGRVPEFR